MNKVYGIIYRTTNLVNGRMYIGKHVVSEDYDGSFDGYLGSGTLLKRAINFYGEDKFMRETLKECFSEEELCLEEEKFLRENHCAENPVYYNQINSNYLGGRCSGYKHSDETKEKIRESSIKRGISDETREKMLVSRQGIHPIQSEEKKNSLRKYWESPEGNSRKLQQSESMKGNKYAEGFKQSESTKQKRSESLTGKVWVHKGSDKTRVDLEDLDKYLSEGWVQGLPKSFSEMRRDAMNSKVIIHKGEIIKTVGKDELPTYLEDGWKPGNMTDSAREKLRKASEGKIWVQNGIEAIKISSEDLQIYLDQGYVRGQKIRPLIK